MKKRSELLSQKNFAVVLIDMQTNFLDEKKELIIPNQIKLFDFCENNAIPVFVFTFKDYGAIHTTIKNKLGTMTKNHTQMFEKDKDDAFSQATFCDVLSEQKITSLILTGVNACACVYETARSAHRRSYDLILSEDLIAGYCNCDDCIGRKEWYERNTMWHKNYSSFIKTLSAKTLANSYS